MLSAMRSNTLLLNIDKLGITPNKFSHSPGSRKHYKLKSLFEINGTTRGAEYDGVNISGVSGPNYGGTLSLVFGNGSAFSGGTIFDLFLFNGSSTGNFASVTSSGFYAGEWTFADDVWLLESGGQTLAFTQSTGDLLITVPEPSTLMLLSGVAVANMIRRRRR
jgi:hypothetical protein